MTRQLLPIGLSRFSDTLFCTRPSLRDHEPRILVVGHADAQLCIDLDYVFRVSQSQHRANVDQAPDAGSCFRPGFIAVLATPLSPGSYRW
jgi:hypothetical protein